MDLKRTQSADAACTSCGAGEREQAETTPLERQSSAHDEDHRQVHTDLDGSIRSRSNEQGPSKNEGTVEPRTTDGGGTRTVAAKTEAVPPREGSVEDAAAERRDTSYQALVRPIAELRRDLGDAAPFRSTVGRAHNLLLRSTKDLSTFLRLLDEARAITLNSRERITKRCAGTHADGRPNMLPYCFAVLDELLTNPGARPEEAVEHEERCTLHACSAGGAMQSQIGDHAAGVADALWQEVLTHLRGVLAPSVYAQCTARCVASTQHSVLRVIVPDGLTSHWFDTRMRRQIEGVLEQCAAGTRVEFAAATPTAAT